jgi:hypothetical protein
MITILKKHSCEFVTKFNTALYKMCDLLSLTWKGSLVRVQVRVPPFNEINQTLRGSSKTIVLLPQAHKITNFLPIEEKSIRDPFVQINAPSGEGLPSDKVSGIDAFLRPIIGQFKKKQKRSSSEEAGVTTLNKKLLPKHNLKSIQDYWDFLKETEPSIYQELQPVRRYVAALEREVVRQDTEIFKLRQLDLFEKEGE